MVTGKAWKSKKLTITLTKKVDHQVSSGQTHAELTIDQSNCNNIAINIH